MMRLILFVFLTLLLTACVGGMRTEIISTYGLKPPKNGIIKSYPDYDESVISPTLLIGGDFFVRLFPANPHDLGYRTPRDLPFRMSAYISAKIDNVAVDMSSFRIHVARSNLIKPDVYVAWERKTVNWTGSKEITGCDYDRLTKTEEIINLPVMKGNKLPPDPDDVDKSVVCLDLKFNVSNLELTPEKRFQLHFDYIVNGVRKNAVLYFYPIQYRYFLS
jgi:hypothetical protein